jgi:5-methyltetrahydrofolate--homocysteine methyltransferase
LAVDKRVLRNGMVTKRRKMSSSVAYIILFYAYGEFFSGGNTMSYEAIINAILLGDEKAVQSEVNKEINSGTEAEEILKNGLIAAMDSVGERWKEGEIFLPEVIMCATTMHTGIDILKPLLLESNQNSTGKVVMGTVAGDIHDIGKKVVGYLLEGNGFEVIDLGVDVPDESFIQAVKEHRPDILGLSALLSTTMPRMGGVIKLLEKEGLRKKVQVIVGGASVNDEFSKSVDADGYAPEATSAIEWCKQAVK